MDTKYGNEGFAEPRNHAHNLKTFHFFPLAIPLFGAIFLY